jgi:hypothetical protein
MNSKALIVFVKEPVKGKIKTRLAETLGDEFAFRFYKTCAEHTFNEIEKLNSPGIKVYLFYDGENEKSVKDWAGEEFICKRQNGNDLGIRMKNSFFEIFNSGFHKAVIIGTDIPDLTSEIVEEAFNSLDKSEVVICPANDGGYYLLGMKKLYSFLFEDIVWSTEKVLSQSLDKLNRNGISKKILKTLNDIDTENDLKDWLNSNTSNSPLKIKIKSEFERLVQKI